MSDKIIWLDQRTKKPKGIATLQLWASRASNQVCLTKIWQGAPQNKSSQCFLWWHTQSSQSVRCAIICYASCGQPLVQAGICGIHQLPKNQCQYWYDKKLNETNKLTKICWWTWNWAVVMAEYEKNMSNWCGSQDKIITCTHSYMCGFLTSCSATAWWYCKIDASIGT